MTHYITQKSKGLLRTLSRFRTAKSLIRFRFLFFLTALCLSAHVISAQPVILWNGSVSSDWNQSANWFPAIVPNGGFQALIGGAGHDPVISGAITLHNIIVAEGKQLTIEAGASLDINLLLPVGGAAAFVNNGTVVNHGTIDISIGAGALSTVAINNGSLGTFTNETTFPGGNLSMATINIENSTADGIFSQGVFENIGGTINIGTVGEVSNDGIRVIDGSFTNRTIVIGQASIAVIEIDHTGEDAIEVATDGLFHQVSGTITIGSMTEVANYGIDNAGRFINGGDIDIARSGWSGIRNRPGGIFENRSLDDIFIGTLSQVQGHGIRNEGSIVNNGTIDVKRALNDGLNNNSGGEFENNSGGRLIIGSTDPVGESGISNNASNFTNKGNVNIKSAALYGISNLESGSFFENINGGVINVGTTGGTIGRFGVWNTFSATFTNNASTINIGNTGNDVPQLGRGLENQNATFTNENGALIAIGQNSNTTGAGGIFNHSSAHFTNSSSTIRIDNASGTGLGTGDTAIFENEDGSTIDIGQNQGNVSGSGLAVIGNFTNDNSTVNIDRVGGMAVDMQQGVVVDNKNNGQINIGMNGGDNTISVHGFSVFGTLRNSNSTININNTLSSAIFLAEGFTYNENNGTINIGTSGGAQNIKTTAIRCLGHFENFNGTILMRNVRGSGISVEDATSMFINGSDGTINIGTDGLSDNMRSGIIVQGVFQNNAGSITIDETIDDGILMNGVDDPSFVNESGGDINVFNADRHGLRTDAGTFTNKGLLRIGNRDKRGMGAFSGGVIVNDPITGVFEVDGIVEGISEIEGTLAPGNSPGEFRNILALDIASATLEIEVNGKTPITSHDLLNVQGQATIGGATLAVTINYAGANNDRIVFLTAPSISGTFTNITPALPAFWSLDYTVPGEVALVFNSVLPVELIDFSAVKKENDVLLKWQTATESNNDGFEVQHSADGKEWKILDFVDGQGTTSVQSDYNYQHNRPIGGNNYYRLKQMDHDGRFEYSPIRSILYDDKNPAISLFPNPASDFVNLSIHDSFERGSVLIHNAKGRLVVEQRFAEGQQPPSIDVQHLPVGIYVMRVQLDDQILNHKLIIAHK